MSINKNYLPSVSDPYLRPGDGVQSRALLQTQHEQQLDLALHILSSANYQESAENRRSELKQKVSCQPCVSTDSCNLMAYFFNHSCRILPQAVSCFNTNLCRKEVVRPMSESSYQALDAAKRKFENNTCALGFAVCVIPPAVCLAGGTDIGMIASGILNVIATTTTGFNTYTFTGSVTATEDRGELILKGIGPEVIVEIQKEYLAIADRLKERFVVKNEPEENIDLLCVGIKDRWLAIEDSMVIDGIHTEDVKKILSPLAQVLYEIEVKRSLQLAEVPTLTTLSVTPLVTLGPGLEMDRAF